MNVRGKILLKKRLIFSLINYKSVKQLNASKQIFNRNDLLSAPVILCGSTK